jgi:vitamin B12 transporter
MLALSLRRAAPLLAFCSLALAQPDDDAVVVTASRTEQRIRDAIPHTTVLTRQDIRDSQAVDLPTLLRREAGIEMAQDGGLGGTASLFMRGGGSAQTLVLIDGVRIESAAFGTTAIQHLMLDDIDRIEISRGNVSSLYGSGAMGGVVQVFTRRGSGAPSPYGEVTAGSRDTTKLLAGYGGEFGDTRLNVSVLRLDTRGFSAVDPGFDPGANPDDDGYRNESISASLAQRLGRSHEVGVRLLRTRAKVDYDDSFLGGPTSIQNADQDVGMAQLYWDAQFLERWKSRVVAAEGTDYRTDFLDGAFLSMSNTRNRQLTWNNDVRIAPAHVVSLAAERLEQALDSSTAGQHKRDVNSVRLGYVGKFGAHSVQVNVRNDKYSDFGNADTYFLGYGYDLTEAWRITASSSTAFRAPTFSDLFGFLGLGGNPALRPERAHSYEVGMQWASGANRVRTVAFHTDYTDEITFDNATFTAQNIRKAEVNGVETSYGGRIAGTELRAALTLQDATEQDPGGIERAALRRAKAYGSISAFRSFARWRVGGELLASGERPDVNIVSPFNPVQNPGYTVLNLLARFNYSKNLFFAARLENALAEEYQLSYGFKTAPRGFFLTAGWQP